MKIAYVAPNRPGHFQLAEAMHKAGVLHCFVSGYPRTAARRLLPNLGRKLIHADLLQSIYLLALRLHLPSVITRTLAYLAKLEMDIMSWFYGRNADVFLFYNGCGLWTARWRKSRMMISITEVVNTHIEFQSDVLRDEHERIGLAYKEEHQSEYRRRLEEYQVADFILCPSTFAKTSFILKGLPPRKLIVNLLGFESRRRGLPRGKPSTTSGTFVVLYVGSVSIRKGLRYLVDAFDQMSCPDKELWIVGPSASPSGIEDLVLPPEVCLKGVLKGEALEQCFAEASVFALPTLEDGFGLVTAEAMAAGCPVLASTSSGAPDLFDDGTCGVLVSPRDVEAMKQRLELLSRKPKLRHQFALEAQELAAKLGDWEICAHRLIELLGTCVKNS